MRSLLGKCALVCLALLVSLLLVTSSSLANAVALDKKYDGAKCLVVCRASGAPLQVKQEEVGNDGGRVEQWTANGLPCQVWVLHPVGDGYYVIMNLASGKVLDADEWTIKDNNTKVQHWHRHTTPQYLHNQQWRFEAAGEFFFIANRKSGRVLDVDLFSIAKNSAHVHLWDKRGDATWQQFAIIPLK